MGVNDSPAAVDADDIALLFKNGNSLLVYPSIIK